MPSSCKEIRAAVITCLRASDCVQSGHQPSECIRPPLKDTLTVQCKQLLKSYGDCKRGQIDMRKRFRGNAPITNSAELQGSGGAPQLYGGKLLKDDSVVEEVRAESNDTRK